ncbi:hypothetical protein Acor_23050 [Acrocarpospora corrugata]|uniref:Uncharacterized protein n=1 Tax=Acrocarpospora corrugata TaxID=35763 RepID=A0A5M3VX25_9ACTN|nr:hypothetical protein Acor_23050 [Acrocarpospora corrugata]
MTGSPTILLEYGPFTSDGALPSLSCRLYPGADGTAAGAPSVTALREAFTAAGLPGPVRNGGLPHEGGP